MKFPLPLKRFFLAVGASFGALSCQAQPAKPMGSLPIHDPYYQNYANWLMANEMKKGRILGATMALVNRNGIVWEAAWGKSGFSPADPLAPNEEFHAGSLSKLVTSSAILSLISQNKLSLDDPISLHFPFLANMPCLRFGVFTIRQLLSHQSGLPRMRLSAVFDSSSALAQLPNLCQEPQVVAPGHALIYSDLGYTFLQAVVEKIQGEPFSEAISGLIFQPLHMTQSHFHPSDGMSHGFSAGKPVARPHISLLAAGGLVTTAHDYGLFLKEWLQKTPFQWKSGSEMPSSVGLSTAAWTAQNLPHSDTLWEGTDLQQGLGWRLSPTALEGQVADLSAMGAVAWHSGRALLHRSAAVVLPDKGVGVVVLTHTAEGGGAALRVATKLLEEYASTQESFAKSPTARRSEASVQLENGLYATEMGLVSITGNARKKAELLGRKLELVEQSPGHYEAVYQLLGLVPITINDGLFFHFQSPTRLDIMWGNLVFPFGQRIPDAPTHSAWSKRLGTYKPEPTKEKAVPFAILDRIVLTERYGRLVYELYAPAFFDEPLTGVLETLSDTEARAAGVGQFRGETWTVLGNSIIFSGVTFGKQ